MAKRSVTITAAWIGGACILFAAVISAVPAYLSLRPRAVEKLPATVTDGSSQDSNAFGVVNANQPVVSYDGSFNDYVSKLAALKDRNLERQEFVYSMEGKRVVWRGWVHGVSDIKGVTIVSITASREDSVIEGVGAYFPPSEWRTKLYALRNGDQVEVDAIYQGGSTGLIPVLRGLSISLVEAK